MARNTGYDVGQPIEILDDDTGPGLGIDFGIIVGTSVTLLVAVVLLMLALGNHYAHGPFAG